MKKTPIRRGRTILRIFILLAAAVSALSLGSCNQKSEPGPSDEEILARLDELVPLSQELNEIFVGEGLTPTDKAVLSEYDVGAQYFEVAEDAPYRDMASLKAAAESVYSSDYLKTVYIMAFDGSAENDITPRYKETGGVLYVDIAWSALKLRTMLDLSGATVVESAAEKVKVKVDYTLEGDTGSGGQLTLVLVKQDGVWLLDGPTY